MSIIYMLAKAFLALENEVVTCNSYVPVAVFFSKILIFIGIPLSSDEVIKSCQKI